MGFATLAPTDRMPFADPGDYRICRRLHQRFGKSYYFSTQFFPRATRNRIHALYAFVRIPDEWVDNPDSGCPNSKLQDWRRQLLAGVEGIRPEHPAMRAFVDVVTDARIPLDEPLLFLDAMAQDLSTTRYSTYENLRAYMRGSAASVGIMMTHALGAERDDVTMNAAVALGEAMQLTNFLRDVGEDARRGRIYLPREDLDSFGVDEANILSERFAPEVEQLMRFQIARARALYRKADMGIPRLPREAQIPIALASRLYEKILDRLEVQNANPFIKRARTSSGEKLLTAMQLVIKNKPWSNPRI